VSTRRGALNTKRSDPIGTFGTPASRKRQGSTVTVLAIEQTLADVGIRARLSDIVAKTGSIENAIIRSRTCRKRGNCAE
jgi:hypothetical protein